MFCICINITTLLIEWNVIKHFRYLLPYCFHSKKKRLPKPYQFISETYSTSLVKTCEKLILTIQKWWFWFKRQRTSSQPKKSEDAEALQAQVGWKLSSNVWLAEELNVGKLTASDHLHAMGKSQKKANEFHMNCLNWLFEIV